jgi:hypothetical protein
LKDVVKGSEFATAIGILQYAFEQKKDLYMTENESIVGSVISESVGDLSNKVKKFFSDLF